MTLSQLLEAYRQTLPSRHLTPQTVRSYNATYRHLESALDGKTQVASLTDTHLSVFLKYLSARGFAQTVRYVHLRTTRVFLLWAYEQGHLAKNLAALLRLKASPPPAVWVPTPEQVQQLLEAPASTGLGPRNRFVMELLYGTGLRRRELRALNLADIEPDGTGLWVRQGKGHKDRLQPLGPRLQKLLKTYLDQVRPGLRPRLQEDALILSRFGDRLAGCTVDNLLSRYADPLGMSQLTPHSLRRAFATHMLLRGAPLVAVQHLLGHESPETTVRYTQIGVGEVQREYDRTHPRARQKKNRAKRV
jgi:site-specific recombinase XerD